jgi:hypothetical protein
MSSSLNDVATRNTSSTNNRDGGTATNTNDLSDNRWRAGSDRLYSSYGVNAGDNFTNNSSGVNNSGGLLSAAVRYETVILHAAITAVSTTTPSCAAALLARGDSLLP